MGNRKGWRLPSIQELASLIDPTVPPPGPTLPPGHPFSNVQVNYWSATTYAVSSASAWVVNFLGEDAFVSDKFGVAQDVWCVRGGQGVDPQ